MFTRKFHYLKYSLLSGLILVLAQSFFMAQADVVVQPVVQSPANPIIVGDAVSYSVTVVNGVSEPDVFINIGITIDQVDVSQLFTSTDCSADGIFFCSQLLAGSTQTYVFTTVTTVPADFAFEFNVGCGQDCQGDTIVVSPPTRVEAQPITNVLNISAEPGTVASGSFTVSDAAPTTISATLGQVLPTSLPAGGGEVFYSFAIPANSQVGSTISDTITVTDDAGNQSQFSVIVTVISGLAGLEGLTDNEMQVAEVLDIACSELSQSSLLTETQTKLLSICNTMDSLDTATLVSAMQQMTPSQAPAQANLSFQSSNTQLNNVDARLSALRSGVSGYSIAGLTFNYGGLSLPAYLFSNQQNNLTQAMSEAEKSPGILPKFGFFINGNLSFGDKADTDDELGFDFNTYGLTAGVDYRITENLVAGGAFGLVNSDSDFNHSQGNVDISGYSLLAYSTFYLDQASYLEAVISLGRNNFNNSRNVSVGLIDLVAKGETDGDEQSVSIGAGYDFSKGAATIGSYVKLNYIRADIDAYHESSSSGLELSFKSQSSESVAMNIGGQISYAVSMDTGVLLPTLRFDWFHEYKDDSRFITASFLNDPTQAEFDLQTESPDRDFFQLGVGATTTFGAGRSAYFFYESMVGQADVSQYSLTGGLRIDF